ncbi:MAG: Crp/Fnr family transcriptional regulator [Patescibacteria group bacterium]
MAKSNLETRIGAFYSQFPLHTFKKGEIIILPDDNPSVVFYLKEGLVREYAISLQGIEITLHIFHPHSYFPMMWAIADIPNRYYYEAFGDVQLFRAPKDKVIAFLKENSDILLELTKRVFQGLDKLTSRIEYLSYGKAYERVVSVLLYLDRHFGKEKDKQIHFENTFTHRDIGSLAGITRETTSRELEKLKKKGIISYDHQSIIINDIGNLKSQLS